MSNGVFHFNFLALLLSEILGGSQIYIRGPCAPRRPSNGKILTCAQVLAYVYITVKFQLRSSIHAGLTERFLYNRFALKNLPKWGFWASLGEGLRYLVGTHLGMQWPPIYVVWWKNYGDTLNTLVCTRGKEITKKTKKTECLCREGYNSPRAALTPSTPSYPVVHVGSYGRRNHSCTISAQPVQGLGSYGTPKFPISYT